MATFKCKMCGGTLEISPNSSVIECEYCGTPQTLPKLHDEKLNNMFERADQLRRAKDFDKALEIYEEILTEKNDDPEVYWSLVLCKYGIEYVDDPLSGQKIPTVNRAQFTSIYDDPDYQSAIRCSDTLQKMLYEKEAAAINEIQKGILSISNQEEPYDVFICYKETDENGERTHDSVYADELYYELTDMGYKVFFARITLEDKLGSAYEPYIFAALNSAKVMVVIGTKPEYFNAVWVKNEWSRFLSLMKKDRKRTLIPAYRNMDPYNLPKEFSHLQALDMNKLGFMSDLTRGIKKIIGEKTQPAPQYQPQPQYQPKPQIKQEAATPKPKEKSWYIGSVEVSSDTMQKIKRYLTNNNKLDAIKYVREVSGLSLVDAKNWVESYHNLDLNQPHVIHTNPASFDFSEIKQGLQQGANELGKQINEGIKNIQHREDRYRDVSTSIAVEELKKKRTHNIVLGIVFIILFWPVAIYFFYKVYKINKEIKAIDRSSSTVSKEDKPRTAMKVCKIICFVLAGIYALAGISEFEISALAAFFVILGLMFWGLEKTPKGSIYMFGKESGIKKSTFVWACVIAAFVLYGIIMNSAEMAGITSLPNTAFLSISKIGG